MKIEDLDKLKVGDCFRYNSHPAVVTWVRPKDDSLTIGTEETDKSICFSFQVSVLKAPPTKITLVGRIDAKMDVGGFLYNLDLEQYQPA